MPKLSIQETTIKFAKVKKLKAELFEPFRTALGQHDFLENVLFGIELEDGTQGFGEAAVATHITGETIEQTLQNLEFASQELIGQDISDYLKISNEFSERYEGNSCALAALEMALLDALTKQLQIPLWEFFGSTAHLLKTDMTVVLGSIEQAQESAREIYKRGIRSFKIKIGGNEEEDFERVLAISKIIKKSAIYLDANQGFSAEQTLRFLKHLRNAGIKPTLIEQPVPKHDWEGLAKVTRESRVTVVADESVTSLSDALRIVREKCASAINIKFMKFGILCAREIATLARVRGLKLMMGGMMETHLATTASAHFASGMSGFDFIDLDAPLFIKEKIMKKSFLRSNGVYDLRTVRAGIGIEPILNFFE